MQDSYSGKYARNPLSANNKTNCSDEVDQILDDYQKMNDHKIQIAIGPEIGNASGLLKNDMLQNFEKDSIISQNHKRSLNPAAAEDTAVSKSQARELIRIIEDLSRKETVHKKVI